MNRISNLYFKATEKSIEKDLTAAIELLKSLPDENSRASAAAYMDGLSQLRSEWILANRKVKNSAKNNFGRKKR